MLLSWLLVRLRVLFSSSFASEDVLMDADESRELLRLSRRVFFGVVGLPEDNLFLVAKPTASGVEVMPMLIPTSTLAASISSAVRDEVADIAEIDL